MDSLLCNNGAKADAVATDQLHYGSTQHKSAHGTQCRETKNPAGLIVRKMNIEIHLNKQGTRSYQAQTDLCR